MSNIKIGIIGGTGLEDPQILTEKVEKVVTTEFGAPSSPLIVGQINGIDIVLLSRHGKGHEIGPTDINYRANILALKNEGCTLILSTHACGSLKENYKIGDLVILDQFINATFKRDSTFYSADNKEGSNFTGVSHVPMGDPFCEETRKILTDAIKELEYSFQECGTIVVIEGPRFSTRAESRMFGSWGGDVIGMTTVPEVCLAKEVGISYASIAMVTDYDSWKEGDHVTVEKVYQVIKDNSVKATNVLIKAIDMIGRKDWSEIINSNKNVVSASLS